MKMHARLAPRNSQEILTNGNRSNFSFRDETKSVKSSGNKGPFLDQTINFGRARNSLRIGHSAKRRANNLCKANFKLFSKQKLEFE